MLQFDEYKVKLNNLAPTLEELGQALDLEGAERELDMLQAESAADGFWNNLEKAQKVQQRIKTLQNKVDKQHKRCQEWDDLMALCEMGNEFEDESLVPELEEGFAQLERDMEEARLQTLLTGEYDSSNVILTIHPGAGGTEAQDWAQMLYRMYTRWAERHGFVYKILDYEDGDEAGIKSASISIQGENAYGLLKSENGVHRLVRVSPFDANARRQTSFAALEVMPEIPDDVEVDIRIDGASPDATFCTGIQKLERHSTGFMQEDGLCGSWGNNVPEKSAPEHDEWVGLGLYTDKACRKEMKEDEFNYLTLLGTDADKHIRYYITVCARREKDGFKNSKAWFDYLRLWKTELDSPCTVSIR